MGFHITMGESEKGEGNGHISYPLLGPSHGCTAGCCSGVSIYYLEEYAAPGVHGDQEGFFVLEGTGWVKIGEEEIRIEPEMSFIVPPGFPHGIRKDAGSGPVKVFWFHASP